MAAIYALLAYMSYIKMPSLTGGVLGFDMRPLGMSNDIAAAYISDLTTPARDFYFNVLRPVDTTFIIAFCVVLYRLASTLGGRLFWLTIGAVILYAIADFSENRAVGIVMKPAFHMDGFAPFEMIALMTRIKFGALIIAAVSLFFQWRSSNAKR